MYCYCWPFSFCVVSKQNYLYLLIKKQQKKRSGFSSHCSNLKIRESCMDIRMTSCMAAHGGTRKGGRTPKILQATTLLLRDLNLATSNLAMNEASIR